MKVGCLMEIKHWVCYLITTWAFLGFSEQVPRPLRKPIVFMMGGYWLFPLLDLFFTDQVYDEALIHVRSLFSSNENDH